MKTQSVIDVNTAENFDFDQDSQGHADEKAETVKEIGMFSTPSLSRWLGRLMSMALYVYILLTHMLQFVY